jgi:hypothetical protein
MASSDLKGRLILRWVGICLAILLFIWLPIEDTNVVFVLLLSAGFCSWIAARWCQAVDRSTSPSRAVLVGAVLGLAVTPFALILVVVKAGVHAHGFVDFTNEQLILILKSTPIWVLLGASVGRVLLKSSSA